MLLNSTPFLLLLSAASVVNAHYWLTTPLSRGHDDLHEAVGPCAGYPVESTRTPFSLNGDQVFIQSYHSVASLDVYISNLSNPSKQTDFTLIQSNIACTLGQISSSSLDFKSILPTLIVGANATIQTIYNGPDGILYQCGDITLTAALTNATSNGTSNGTLSDAASAGYLASLSIKPVGFNWVPYIYLAPLTLATLLYILLVSPVKPLWNIGTNGGGSSKVTIFLYKLTQLSLPFYPHLSFPFTIYAITYLLFSLYCCFYNLTSWKEDGEYPRFAYLALSNFALAPFLSVRDRKFNPLLWIPGVQFESLLSLHVLYCTSAIGLCLVHGSLYLGEWLKTGEFQLFFSGEVTMGADPVFGLAALCLLGLTFLVSNPVAIYLLTFRVFKILHVLLYPTFLIIVYLHTPNTVMYLFPAFLVWVVGTFSRGLDLFIPVSEVEVKEYRSLPFSACNCDGEILEMEDNGGDTSILVVEVRKSLASSDGGIVDSLHLLLPPGTSSSCIPSLSRESACGGQYYMLYSPWYGSHPLSLISQTLVSSTTGLDKEQDTTEKPHGREEMPDSIVLKFATSSRNRLYKNILSHSVWSVQGPFGHAFDGLFLTPSSVGMQGQQKVLMIGAGMGVTPLLNLISIQASLASRQPRVNTNIKFVYICQRLEFVEAFQKEFEEILRLSLQSNEGLTISFDIFLTLDGADRVMQARREGFLCSSLPSPSRSVEPYSEEKTSLDTIHNRKSLSTTVTADSMTNSCTSSLADSILFGRPDLFKVIRDFQLSSSPEEKEIKIEDISVAVCGPPTSLLGTGIVAQVSRAASILSGQGEGGEGLIRVYKESF